MKLLMKELLLEETADANPKKGRTSFMAMDRKPEIGENAKAMRPSGITDG